MQLGKRKKTNEAPADKAAQQKKVLLRKKEPKEKQKKKKGNAVMESAEYKHFRVLRLTNLFILLAFLAGIAYTGFFLYKKIYRAIGQVEHILLIESPTQGDAIEFDLLDKTRANWEIKANTERPTVGRDPFAVPQSPVLEDESP